MRSGFESARNLMQESLAAAGNTASVRHTESQVASSPAQLRMRLVLPHGALHKALLGIY